MVIVTGYFLVVTEKDKKFYLTNLFNNKTNNYSQLIYCDSSYSNICNIEINLT